ncbi:MAG: DUF3048 C-terminal domain-containing protein [Anaerolineales bacterium]
MMKFNKIILILLLVLAVSAISLMPSFAHHSLAFSSREIQTISTYGPVLTATPLPNFGWKPTKTHQDAPPQEAVASGPDQFAKGINPLTGLPVTDPDLLAYPPALISVSNFPVSARPQAGLSFSPTVFELFIGEGMTRFLALFYGEYPQVNAQNGDASVITNNQAEIGPVRSGRLPYQAIRQLYNGFLVMASASAEVQDSTSNSTNIYGSDSDDINSALIDVSQLEALAKANVKTQPANLTGNTFSIDSPEGGQLAEQLWVFYNFYNQVQWTYDRTSGKYLRSQDKADGSGNFYPATDRLTGEQLAFENVIVLSVKHEVLNSAKTLIDFDLLYTRGDAYLLRDGIVYPIYWSTIGDEYEKETGRLRPIRFTDRNGEPIPLKPGSSWVEVVDVTTTFSEIEPGRWKARFYAP